MAEKSKEDIFIVDKTQAGHFGIGVEKVSIAEEGRQAYLQNCSNDGYYDIVILTVIKQGDIVHVQVLSQVFRAKREEGLNGYRRKAHLDTRNFGADCFIGACIKDSYSVV